MPGVVDCSTGFKFAGIADVVTHCLFAAAAVHDKINHAKVVHFFCAVYASTEYHPLDPDRIKTSAQHAVSSHPGEQIEENLRQAYFYAAFGNYEIAAKRSLKTSAKSVALQKAYGNNTRIETNRDIINCVHATVGVTADCFPIMITDPIGQKRKISTYIVDAGNLRGLHVVSTRGSSSDPWEAARP